MENTSPQGIDIQAEKKKNIWIAVGIGVTGIGMLILFYAVLFAIMFTSPSTIFRMMPIPDISKSAVGFQGKLFVFSKTIDVRNIDFQHEPRDITVMREFEGGKLREPQEIAPFSSVASDADAVYFFHEEGYRTFDGRSWTDIEIPDMGDCPKGMVDHGRIWVLSEVEDTPQLMLLEGDSAGFVPLPFDEVDVSSLYRLDIVSLNGMLNLFERDTEGLMHYVYTSEGWSEPELLQEVNNYRLFPYNGRLWLYTKRLEGNISERSFDGKSWSEPVGLSFGAGISGMSFRPVQYENQRALLLDNPFQSELYVLDNDGAVSRKFPLGSTMMAKFVPFMVVSSVVSIGLMMLLVFVFSSVVNRFKLRRWPAADGRTYEFASFFRRFLAFTLDMFVLMTPLNIAAFFLFEKILSSPEPFGLVAIFMALMILFMLVVPFLYFSLFEGLGGKTPGKYLCGIRVLKDDFTRCGIGAAMLRTLLRIVDLFFYYMVAAITIGATLKWQRVGDVVASTVVVRDRKTASPRSPIGAGPGRP